MTAHRLPRLLLASAALAVAAAALLMLVRIDSAISLTRPLLVGTSGAEEEGVMGILRAMEGAAYVDPSRIPFAASYYNWLFFSVFAGIIGAVKAALSLDVAWVPTIGRFVGLAGAGLCWVMSALAIARLAPPTGATLRLHNRLLAAWLAIGPLVGWWALSLNPELWATGLSEAAVVVVLAWYGRRPLLAVALASLLSVAAWSFKQNYLFVALALGLFLLLRRDGKAIAVLVAIHLAGLGLPQLVGSADYRAMMLAFQGSDFALWQWIRNVTNVTGKTLPVMLAALLVLPGLRRWREVLADPPLLLSLCGLLASLAVVPASAKVGAAENYYFPLVFFLGLLAARGVSLLEAAGWPRLPGLALAAAWAVELVVVGLVLAGVSGVRSVASMDARHRAERDCVAGLPSPMFAPDPYLQLPWMHAEGPHFVLAYQYFMERAHGRRFEGGGIGGLITTGYFAALAMPAAWPARFDGATFDRYERRPDVCAGLTIYLRRRP